MQSRNFSEYEVSYCYRPWSCVEGFRQRVTRDGERGYVLDQEEAVVNLLRGNGTVDANPTRAPIVIDV